MTHLVCIVRYTQRPAQAPHAHILYMRCACRPMWYVVRLRGCTTPLTQMWRPCMMEKSSSQHHLSPYIFDVPQTSSKICLPCLGRRGAVRGAGPGGVAGSRVSSTAVSFRLFCDVYLSSRSLPPGPCVSICHTYTVLIDDRRHSRQREREHAHTAQRVTHTLTSQIDRQTPNFNAYLFRYTIYNASRVSTDNTAHTAPCLT